MSDDHTEAKAADDELDADQQFDSHEDESEDDEDEDDDDSAGGMDLEDLKCPYCESVDECEHLLLWIDTDFCESRHGPLLEKFNRKWSAIQERLGDDGDHREGFFELTCEVDALASADLHGVFEGGPGASFGYTKYYCSTALEVREAVKNFYLKPRSSPIHIARFCVSWADGDVSVELHVAKLNYGRLQRGEKVSIRGKGYTYEGDFFWDYWNFEAGLQGELTVNYGSPKDGDYSGEGWIGRAISALDPNFQKRV
ncbi:hypothetical protein [Asticcacaulis sp. AC402]|uniref:hypothetical protein n=1 Tax=Asticcacaulis sp. AC402 TaxID=1282361 RepID=UPI0003C3E3E4|nr:hypothetical protein [Asticcacaulis sp. AC402]ESQ73722.1 hypothetical protein ABAC402_17810 [Asticcacaulis sp. AC402]